MAFMVLVLTSFQGQLVVSDRLSMRSIPLVFERNVGQALPDVLFVAHLGGVDALFRMDGFELACATPGKSEHFRMRFKGARGKPLVEGEALNAKVNYLLGRDAAKWIVGVPTYARIKYANLYPGIDLVFRGSRRGLEYDLVVAPGANANAFRLVVSGAGSPQVDSEGRLVWAARNGRVLQFIPEVYEMSKGGSISKPVAAFFTERNVVGLRVGVRDLGRGLVVDPVVVYSTYIGGTESDQGISIAIDRSDFVYVTGATNSNDFPVAGAFQDGGVPGLLHAFVSKLAPGGSSLIYSTYIGGSGAEQGFAIAVDDAGSAYVVGTTTSLDFPTVGAIQGALAGGVSDAFVLRLSPSGSSLQFSTYLGGTGREAANAARLSPTGVLQIVGGTSSADFPLRDPSQPSYGGGLSDAFVVSIDGAGSIVSSTYLGGGDDDVALGVVVDTVGAVYVTGRTASADFRTTGFQTVYGGGVADAFVTKFTEGGILAYSTFLGGEAYDVGNGIAVDRAGAAFVTGRTASSMFPVRNALQSAGSGGFDAFVTRLDVAGSALEYSTHLGGAFDDNGSALAVSSSGVATVVGWTNSNDFPLQSPLQSVNGGGRDAFIARVGRFGSPLLFSTFMGGGGTDVAESVTLTATGNVVVAGFTTSSDFPEVNSRDAGFLPPVDVIVAEIGDLPSDEEQLDGGSEVDGGSVDGGVQSLPPVGCGCQALVAVSSWLPFLLVLSPVARRATQGRRPRR